MILYLSGVCQTMDYKMFFRAIFLTVGKNVQGQQCDSLRSKQIPQIIAIQECPQQKYFKTIQLQEYRTKNIGSITKISSRPCLKTAVINSMSFVLFNFIFYNFMFALSALSYNFEAEVPLNTRPKYLEVPFCFCKCSCQGKSN